MRLSVRLSSVRLLWGLLGLLVHLAVVTYGCVAVDDCGWKSESCQNTTCICPTGYSLHSNTRDCHNSTCTSPDCLECSSGVECTRCVYFLVEGTRQCVSTCTGEAKFVYSGPIQGSICILVSETDNSDVIIGVIAGVSAGLFLCMLVLIGFCIHIKRTRRNVNLNQTHYGASNMQNGNVKKFPMYDNQGFDKANEPSLVHNMVDREVYSQEIDKLKPQAHTLLTMLNEIRHKLRAMDKDDPRVSTYKGVIHQLCRVLVLIHKKGPITSIPSDALGLIQWAHQMIEDRQLEPEPAEDSLETIPVNKISYVEVPATKSNPYATPVIKKPNPYATLNKRHSQLNMSNVTNQSTASFYSSVAVPVELKSESQVNHVSVSQTNTLSSNKETLKRQYEIPWDLRKTSDSMTTLNCSGSDLTMGYFANGRFYDPSPRQPSVKREQPADIYAPASSYSDRSNPPIFSTFAGGVPRNQSFTSSQTSQNTNSNADADMTDDQLENDEEAFPFDIRDATEPVEV